MSIFGKIKDAIFGHHAQAAPAQQPQAPQQQPAARHPSRPIACPTAIPGANASEVASIGIPCRFI